MTGAFIGAMYAIATAIKYLGKSDPWYVVIFNGFFVAIGAAIVVGLIAMLGGLALDWEKRREQRKSRID